MIVHINGKFYNTAETPVLLIFDDEEQKVFEMARYLSAPLDTSKEEQKNLLHMVVTDDVYYFITFLYGASEKNIYTTVINEHPLVWQKGANKQYPGQYVLKDWKEITKEEFHLYEKLY